MKIGFTLYNFSNIIENADELETVLARLNEMGVDVVQVSGIGKVPNSDVARLCRKYGMEVCITHSPLSRILNDTEALIEEHKALGCNSVGIGWIPDEYHSAEGMADFIEKITPAAQKIKDAGMQFAYHNHSFEFERYNGRLGMDILVEDTDPDLVHFIPDVHWLQTGGVNPPDYLRKLKGRVEVCHFKDYRIVDNKRDFAEIGTGNLNLDACWKACEEIGAKYIIIEQDSCTIDLFESAKISWLNLKEIAKRNGAEQ